MQCDVAVIGAGAAGLMCAIEAGKRGRKVLVLEHQDRAGRKILISGGGRCNFTNLHCTPRNFLSANPHFCKSALARYTPQHFLALVAEHRIAFYEKTLGQLFCSGSAREIVDMLLFECRSAGVRVITGCQVRSVERAGCFRIHTSLGEVSAAAVVVASGGLSIPKLGATDLGYSIAQAFGHSVVPCRPALVPFVWQSADQRAAAGLSGVSTEVIASIHKTSFREKMLFTHVGLSGPAILQISSYWQEQQPVGLDLTPDFDLDRHLLDRKRSGDQSLVKTLLAELIPRRLAEYRAPAAKLSETRDRDLQGLQHWVVTPGGTEGYAKAEVTAGGVDTCELSSQTMESARVPGLYFIGEVVDVTGHLGGYNFQWAWASGYSAGQAA